MLLDDLLLAGAAAVAGGAAARWGARLDAKFAQIYGKEFDIDSATTTIFITNYNELAWDQVLCSLEEKDQVLRRYLSSLGDHWEKRKEFSTKLVACKNEDDLRALYNQRWFIRLPVAGLHGTVLGTYHASSTAALTDNQAMQQDIEAERCLKNYNGALLSAGPLGAAVRQLRKLTGSTLLIWENFLEAGRHRIKCVPGDQLSLRAKKAIADEWGQESSVHGFAIKIADVNDEIHTAFIESDEKHLWLRSDLLAMRAATLEQLLPFLTNYELYLMPEEGDQLVEGRIYLKAVKESKEKREGNFCEIDYTVKVDSNKSSPDGEKKYETKRGTIKIHNPKPLGCSNDGDLAAFNRNKERILEALVKNRDIPISAGLHHSINQLALDLRLQSKALKQEHWLFIKHQFFGYLIYFIPALVLGVSLLAATLIAPLAITAASFWMMGIGCITGLVGGFWCLHQFFQGESKEDLHSRVEQLHGSLFNRFLRRSYDAPSATLATTPSNVRQHVDQLRRRIVAELKNTRAARESRSKKKY